MRSWVRETVPFVASDRPLYVEIEALAQGLLRGELDARLAERGIPLD